MQIEWVDINLLVPYADNAKKHPEEQIQAIATQIKEAGFDQPIVVAKDYTIIKGHGRWLAAKYLQLAEVPIVMKNVTPEQASAQRIADNKIAKTDWDQEKLIRELKYLESKEYDMHLTGFVDEEIQALLTDLDREIDYSALGGDAVDAQVEEMTKGVRKGIMIDFATEDYEEAYMLTKFFRERGEYVGGILMQTLRERKNTVD